MYVQNTPLTRFHVSNPSHVPQTLLSSWPTFQYMVSEVQYGGKITDDLDRRMFKTYTQVSYLTTNRTEEPDSPQRLLFHHHKLGKHCAMSHEN